MGKLLKVAQTVLLLLTIIILSIYIVLMVNNIVVVALFSIGMSFLFISGVIMIITYIKNNNAKSKQG